MQARALAFHLVVVVGLAFAAEDLDRSPDVVPDALQAEGQIAVSLPVARREFTAATGEFGRPEVRRESLFRNGCRVGHHDPPGPTGHDENAAESGAGKDGTQHGQETAEVKA
jgi:hypothetical protein